MMRLLPGKSASLLYQASTRLLLALGIAVLAIGLLMGWIIHLSQEKAAQREIADAMAYFSESVRDMELRWQEAAIRYKGRLEFMRMLEDPDRLVVSLNSYLTTQISGETFPAMLVADPRNRVLFSFGFGEDAVPTSFSSPPDIGWHYDKRDSTLYRYYVQHVWLGKQGMGHLILFLPLTHGLLHQMATPNTHLFLRWKGEVVASSLGEHGKTLHLVQHDGPMEHDGMRVEQRSFTWGGTGPDSPELVVHRQTGNLFDFREISLGLLVGVGGLLAALWGSIGVWVYRNTRRIAALGRASRQFLLDYHSSPEIKRFLEQARSPRDDEINEVVRSLEMLTDTVALRDAEREAQRIVLQESEARVREITSVLPDGLYVLNQFGVVTFVNPEAERLLGWTAAELVGKDGHDTFHYKTPDGQPISSEDCPVHKTIRTGQTYRSINDWLVRKDGAIIPVSIVSSPIVHDGGVRGSVAAFHDITSRLEAERALRESEARFRAILENAPIGMAIGSLEGRFLQVNRALCDILGYTKEELEKLNFQQISHPDDLDASLANLRQLVSGEVDSYLIEKRYICKDGSMVWVQLTVSLLRDAAGAPLCMIGQMENITERRAAEQALQESEERFRLISSNAMDAIVIVGPSQQITYWNPAAEVIFGYPASEALGQNLHYLIAPLSHRETALRGFAQFLAAGEGAIIGKTFEISALRKDGREFPIELSISAFRIKDQWHALGIIRDISERKRAEQEYKTIIQTTMDGFLVVDAAEGRFLDANDAYCKMLGYRREELLTLRVSDIEAMESPEQAKQHRADLREKGQAKFETRHRSKDGDIIDVEVSVTYLDLRGGVLIAFIRDISERKRTEEQIRQLAYYDTLTNLPNRRMLMDRLRQSLNQAIRHQRSLAVMFLDLDRFKLINDTLGHDAGDALLKAVASRLNASVRSGDTVSRQGGDEFVIVLAEIAQPTDAALIAEKILATLSQPVSVMGHELFITTSIGISVYPVNGSDDMLELMKKADIAMYAAKEAGRNRYRFYQG